MSEDRNSCPILMAEGDEDEVFFVAPDSPAAGRIPSALGGTTRHE
jgi:hypothetical protein